MDVSNPKSADRPSSRVRNSDPVFCTKILLALKKQVNGFMLFSREKKDELTSQAC